VNLKEGIAPRVGIVNNPMIAYTQYDQQFRRRSDLYKSSSNLLEKVNEYSSSGTRKNGSPTYGDS
jgi:hypothetical protein